jgi:hypothetical protein
MDKQGESEASVQEIDERLSGANPEARVEESKQENFGDITVVHPVRG